ncbi:MAG: hypothetical protein F6J93_15250 [Oscillatoria sp. SIO1A7]|nr:hypothetical protein [Oscillatoria sp. SIO1A7]
MSSKERQVLELVLLLLKNELDSRKKERLSRKAGASETGADALEAAEVALGKAVAESLQDLIVEVSSDREDELPIKDLNDAIDACAKIKKDAPQDAAAVLPLMNALQSLRRG